MNAKAIVHSGEKDIQISFEAPMLLGDLLNRASYTMDRPCGGRGKCGKCSVAARGNLSPMHETELQALSEAERDGGMRLACQAYAQGDVEIRLNAAQGERILTNFVLPARCGKPWGDGLGIAIDIGTTTLAAYLYDLSDARLIAVESGPNPQRSYGADVISRIEVSLAGKGDALRSAITEAISDLKNALLQGSGGADADLHCAVLTGNTAMLYLLTGEPVDSISCAPFEPGTRFGCRIEGERVGLPAHTKVWLPDCIAAYVGADISCALLYAGFLQEAESAGSAARLLADIGTNGEMALCAHDEILTCSTAAGPAFEGAGISCGMTAQQGAISRVEIDGDRLRYSAIGGARAIGICGSGLVDAIAVLLDLEVIDEAGRLQREGHPLAAHMVEIDNQIAFRFPNSDVYITQADVRAVQLAKAAICAGVHTLLDVAGIDPDSVAELQIAGGFGSFIRPESAERIGLIPEGFAVRARAIGNAAGAGAAMMLLDDQCIADGQKLSRICRTIELSNNPVFTDYYIDCMSFE